MLKSPAERLLARLSSLIDWSSEEGEPIDMVDSFDLSEGPATLVCVDGDGVISPVLDTEDDIVAEWTSVLPDVPEKLEGGGTGERLRKNCFGFLRNVSAGFRPLRCCFSDGDGDGVIAVAVETSERWDIPEKFLWVMFFPGVDALRKTARR